MIRLGQIRITDKVYFEYYRLKLPSCYKVGQDAYFKAFDKYEASKRSIEVSNVERYGDADMCTVFIDGKFIEYTKNNQKCKAEITNNTATIVELTKE